MFLKILLYIAIVFLVAFALRLLVQLISWLRNRR